MSTPCDGFYTHEYIERDRFAIHDYIVYGFYMNHLFYAVDIVFHLVSRELPPPMIDQNLPRRGLLGYLLHRFLDRGPGPDFPSRDPSKISRALGRRPANI